MPFQYQAEFDGRNLTARAGLGLALDFLAAIRLPETADALIGLRTRQGYGDGQMLTALLLLNLAGGEAVQAVDTLEQDEGHMALVRQLETWGPPGAVQAAAPGQRFRRARVRTLPPTSAASVP